MATLKKTFICENCGVSTPRWQGRCPNCGEWNTLKETTGGSSKLAAGASAGQVIALADVSEMHQERLKSGLNELDAVLGGGIVPGSLILLGGDPGIGKSTLALQIANSLFAKGRTVLYVSGEESPQQIKMRAQRLPDQGNINVMPETNLETVLATMVSSKPNVVIIDSIQTLQSENVNGVVGGVSQLSYATNALLRTAKENHIATILIGHVTKEGMLAGPKTIEHMVDAVLYLEGDRLGVLRLLRSSKNRFGSIGEVGIFEMREQGLVEVPNPSALFLEHMSKPAAGSCVTAVMEGNKVMLVEVQALTNTTTFGYPKRTTSGFDVNRLQLIIAILQKSLKVNLSNQDVYINVAGGFKLEERAADLPVALAILSSYYGVALPAETIAFGEIGLLGEIRAVSQADKRIKEAEKLGFKQIIASLKNSKTKIKMHTISSVRDIIHFFEQKKKA
jgi:DNA repair protein RadA/Sms